MKFDDILLSMPQIKAIYTLRTQFNINVTLTQYHTQKQKILEDYITDLTNGKIYNIKFFSMMILISKQHFIFLQKLKLKTKLHRFL